MMNTIKIFNGRNRFFPKNRSDATFMHMKEDHMEKWSVEASI